VPAHLRDAHYRGAGTIGPGDGYLYAHDDPRGVAPQRHVPDIIRDATYYHPTTRGAEAQYSAQLERIRAILTGEPPRRDR
jgi:putative ATPase